MAGRERNPERSRERILDAAFEEFAAHGYAGARVDAIAARAGLNKQLISHHFGGKAGLYRSVMAERRMRGGGELVGTAQATSDALAGFFERAPSDPEWIRVLLWESLEGNSLDDAAEADRPSGTDRPDAATVPMGHVAPSAAVVRSARRGRYEERIAWVVAEQDAGGLPPELEPELLLLTLLGASLYPLLLPDVCELMTGQRPDDDGFAARYAEHLQKFARHLSA